jgi:hypothetical protein
MKCHCRNIQNVIVKVGGWETTGHCALWQQCRSVCPPTVHSPPIPGEPQHHDFQPAFILVPGWSFL